MGSIIRSIRIVFYSLLYLNSRQGFKGLKYLCPVISVKMERLPGNTKNWLFSPSWTARVRLVHFWAEFRRSRLSDKPRGEWLCVYVCVCVRVCVYVCVCVHTHAHTCVKTSVQVCKCKDNVWASTGLFCGGTGLFCGATGLFCGATGLLCVRVLVENNCLVKRGSRK